MAFSGQLNHYCDIWKKNGSLLKCRFKMDTLNVFYSWEVNFEGENTSVTVRQILGFVLSSDAGPNLKSTSPCRLSKLCPLTSSQLCGRPYEFRRACETPSRHTEPQNRKTIVTVTKYTAHNIYIYVQTFSLFFLRLLLCIPGWPGTTEPRLDYKLSTFWSQITLLVAVLYKCAPPQLHLC